MKPTSIFFRSKKLISGCLILLIALLFTASCSNKHEYPDPAKATLTFPAQNSLCTNGTVISATQATIMLTWGAAASADSYDIFVKNLLTNATTTQSSTVNQVSVTLQRNTPYAWYVVSKSAHVTVTAQSDTWKFYVAGLGAVSYSPFPATLISPSFAQTINTAAKINLTWAGNDVDDDISNYDVYFGSAATPPLLKANVTDTFLNDVSIAANTTYYWKIATRDSQGNMSYSETYQFKVN